MTVYEARKEALPRWEAYIVYAGGSGARVTRMGGIMEDLFDDSPAADVPVGDGGLLKGYIDVCGIIDRMAAGPGRESVLRAFEACRGCGSVGEFVWSRRYEIMGVYEQLFDEEENLRMNCEAHEKKGRLEGLAEGLAEGRAEGRRLQNEEVARRLVSMGMSAKDVSKATGLTVEEIRRLD